MQNERMLVWACAHCNNSDQMVTVTVAPGSLVSVEVKTKLEHYTHVWGMVFDVNNNPLEHLPNYSTLPLANNLFVRRTWRACGPDPYWTFEGPSWGSVGNMQHINPPMNRIQRRATPRDHNPYLKKALRLDALFFDFLFRREFTSLDIPARSITASCKLFPSGTTSKLPGPNFLRSGGSFAFGPLETIVRNVRFSAESEQNSAKSLESVHGSCVHNVRTTGALFSMLEDCHTCSGFNKRKSSLDNRPCTPMDTTRLIPVQGREPTEM